SVFYDETKPLKADWKLPLYAFLESYHIGTLHKDSIADFFIENIAISEQLGPHIRSFVPRKNVLDLETANLDEVALPDYVTPTNIIFPNICMIAHPTSYSFISMIPGDSVGTSYWRHMLLVPSKPETESEIAHYNKTLAVLDGMTYEREDMWASEQIQEGINAGALDELLLAKHESLLKTFSETVEDYIAS
ncbi:MAG: SRPBCC family protein, partial [Pseudomonadota bacterium]